ncbi:MAG: sel1 repeat family protein [Gammaproteobacteria bacterium]|nr:sel1 repeat family protein [Gammaproteobacteria bacterium]
MVCSRRQILVFFLLMCPFFILGAEELYTKEAIGISKTEEKACAKALLEVKKKALEEAGSIIESNVNSLVQQRDGEVDIAASSNIKEFARGIVRVKSKSLSAREMPSGEFICQISAQLSVDINDVNTSNKKYKGQLPDWVIKRPQIVGKYTVIGDGESLKAAFAAALHNYLIKDKLIDRNISYSQFKSQYFNEDDFTDYAEYKTVKVSENLRLNSSVRWAVEGGALIQDDMIVITYNKNTKGLKYYYLSSNNLNTSVKTSDVFADSDHKQDATLEDLFSHVKQIGLEIEFEKVESSSASRWYVMLIGEETKYRLETLAKNGDRVEQYRVGNYYLEGTQFPLDFEKGLFYIEQSANQGYTAAMLKLGVIYSNYDKADFEKALLWYKKAALDKDHFKASQAQVAIGNMYENGRAVEKNSETAISWYKKAARNIYGEYAVIARMTLGDMYFDGRGIAKDFKQAINWYKKAAEIDSQHVSTLAMYKVAEMYYSGHPGIKQNDAKAVEWYKRSAERSSSWGDASANSEAQYSLGFMYMYGRGVIKSLKKSYQWHIKAANNNHIWAQEEVASGYAVCSLSCDGEKAVFWARKLIKRDGTEKSPKRLAIIAAAFARAGEFESAVEYQMKAMSVISDAEKESLYATNLRLYKQGEATKHI